MADFTPERRASIAGVICRKAAGAALSELLKRLLLARTDDDIDGFSFKVDEKVDALRFVLEIDGKQATQWVEIGKNNRKPQNMPMVARIR